MSKPLPLVRLDLGSTIVRPEEHQKPMLGREGEPGLGVDSTRTSRDALLTAMNLTTVGLRPGKADRIVAEPSLGYSNSILTSPPAWGRRLGAGPGSPAAVARHQFYNSRSDRRYASLTTATG